PRVGGPLAPASRESLGEIATECVERMSEADGEQFVEELQRLIHRIPRPPRECIRLQLTVFRRERPVQPGDRVLGGSRPPGGVTLEEPEELCGGNAPAPRRMVTRLERPRLEILDRMLAIAEEVTEPLPFERMGPLQQASQGRESRVQ